MQFFKPKVMKTLALWREEVEMGTQWNVNGRHGYERDAKQFAKESNTGNMLVSPSGAAEYSRLLSSDIVSSVSGCRISRGLHFQRSSSPQPQAPVDFESRRISYIQPTKA